MTLEMKNIHTFNSTNGLINLKDMGQTYPVELAWIMVETILDSAGYSAPAIKKFQKYPVNIVVATGTISISAGPTLILSTTTKSVISAHGDFVIKVPAFVKHLAGIIQNYGINSFRHLCKNTYDASLTEAPTKKILNKLPELDEEETGGFQMSEETINKGPVNLRDAKALYQPVYGTTTGSIYKVAAITEKGGLKFACKFSGTVLSIRVEGPALMGDKKELQAAGFALKADKYGSVHVNVTTNAQAAKTLGALLFGLGLPIATPIPQCGVLFA